MIGWLSGFLRMRGTDHIVLDVNGVGYIIYLSEHNLSQIPDGERISLFTDLLVREDNLQIFGFLSQGEKEIHKLLVSVQGVGAKAALAIQSTLSADGVIRAIASGDINAIKSAQGVGPKLAQRIVTELKEKAPNMMLLNGSNPSHMNEGTSKETHHDAVIENQTDAAIPSASQNSLSFDADALSALTNLGYSASDAATAIASVSKQGLSTGELIKAALKALS